MKLIKYILLILFLPASISVFSQEPKFTATVSKNKLGINQRFRVQFTVNKQGADNFKPPSFANFKVVGGPSQSVSQSWINGKTSFSQTYTYILQPKKEGELILPSANITIAGEVLQTEPLKITVTQAVETPKDPNDPNYIAEQSIHLVAEISKANPYVGEGVYLEYRLYFSNEIGIYNYNITEAPKYNGFWNQQIQIDGSPVVKNGTYNGEQYRYAVLHKALLIPSKSGKLTIEPMKMDISVQIPTGKADFFGNVITRNVRKEYASARRIVNVKQLPLQSQPENFLGAVGEFNFKVSLSKENLKANESSQIKVSVSGKGNLKLFEIPKIKTPKELEVYQPERKEKVDVTTSGLRGVIANVYTVVPQHKGKYKIPGTSFSYFNPKDNKYHTVTSKDLFVNVLEGKQLVSSEKNKDEKTVVKQTVTETGKNFRYIQTSTNFKPIKNTYFFNTDWYYVLLLLPLLAIPIFIIIDKKQVKRKRDTVGNRSRKADRLARKYLSEAKKQLGNKEAFYWSLEKALHNYLKAKLGVETADISKEKITSILKEKNVTDLTITDFIQVLKDCDFARYTPTDNVKMQLEYEKAKQIITQLDRQL